MCHLLHSREGNLLKVLEENEAFPLVVDLVFLDGEYIRFLDTCETCS